MANDAEICAEGTKIQKGIGTITFTNNNANSSCTAEDDGSGRSLLQLIGESSITVPKRVGSTPGTLTKTILSSATTGTYKWKKPTCCGGIETNPSIILQ
jgi:hypothetical protein